MEIHTCDICDEILQNEVHIVTFAKFRFPDDANKQNGMDDATLDEFYEAISSPSYSQNQIYRKPQTKEICCECWKVLDKFFKIRLKDLKNLKKELGIIEKKLKE